MGSKGLVTLPTLRAVRRLGANRRLFQSSEVREHLGYGEASVEAHRMHAVIFRLKKGGVIEAANGARQRHQYLGLADEDRLRRMIERAAAPSSPPRRRTTDTQEINGSLPEIADGTQSEASRPPAPKRVMYLEERVADLEEQLSKLSGLPTEVREMGVKLDQLIELWS